MAVQLQRLLVQIKAIPWIMHLFPAPHLQRLQEPRLPMQPNDLFRQLIPEVLPDVPDLRLDLLAKGTLLVPPKPV